MSTLITLTSGHTMFKESFHTQINRVVEQLELNGMKVDCEPKQKFSEGHDAVLLVKDYDAVKFRNSICNSRGRFRTKIEEKEDCHMIGLDLI